MKQTVESLKGLYVALGGSADDVKNVTLIPDMIDKITAVVPAAIASELPAVTASNNGAVLKVADGKWSIGTDAVE